MTSWWPLLTRAPLRNVALGLRLRRSFATPWRVVAHRRARGAPREVEAVLRDGRRVAYRTGTADARVLCDLYADDEYRTAALPRDFDTAVDVGAHVGFFSLQVAPLARRVLAFEPEPANFALLARNLSGPAHAHVETVCAAVCDREGTLRLRLGGANTAGHSAYGPGAPGADAAWVDVPCTTLPRALDDRDISRVDLLKLDCEGAEYEVLDTLAAWGLDRVARIAMEHHPAPPGAPSHHGGAGCEMLLRSAGFAVERVPSRHPGRGLLFARRGRP